MPILKRLAPMAAANQSLRQVQSSLRAKRAELRMLQTRVGDLRSQYGDLEQLDQRAAAMQRDVLTDTPNRALLQEHLHNAMALAHRHGTGAAVVFLDVDHFKQINDTLGHASGDAVLQMVARRLQDAVRDSDAVGRRGGDEFLVVLSDVSEVGDVARIAQQIISDVAEPFWIGEHMLQVSVSAGIALYPVDTLTADLLIELADAAMYVSKRRGGGCYSFHSDPATVSDWTALPS